MKPAAKARLLNLADETPSGRWWKSGMLPLYGLVLAAAASLTGHSGLGAWPLLIVLACPLLHLVARGEDRS